MRYIRRLGPLLLALALASRTWAQDAAPAAGGAPGVVIARDFMFAPLTVTIPAGTTLTWTNRDDEPHTVVSDTGLFRSGALDTNESFSFKFEKPGTYHYECLIHPTQMMGKVIVT